MEAFILTSTAYKPFATTWSRARAKNIKAGDEKKGLGSWALKICFHNNL
jgi:hypothetical protein